LHDEWNRLASGGCGDADNGQAAAPMSHRLLAMRITTGAVEHTLVHGLHPKQTGRTAAEIAAGWQVDPRSIPEAGCVDMGALANMVAMSTPPPAPFALFAGTAAWESLLKGIVDEAVTEREATAAAWRSAQSAALNHAAAALKGAAPKGEAGAAGVSASEIIGELPQTRLLLLCKVLVPNAAGGRAALPGTATADAAHVLPLYLLHYGISTAPVGAAAAPALPLPKVSEQGGKGDDAGGKENARSKGSAKSEKRKAAAKAAVEEVSAGPEPLVPPSLRHTREFSEVASCQRRTATRMRDVAHVFGSAIEGIAAQLTPSKVSALVADAQREAELQVMISDAKAELTKLKKMNRDLASELQTTY
jgi:hypothetical protein